LNRLTAALRSSVGKKFVMGISGLFLCFFLVIHLAGNALLYVGADHYNEYAHKLHSMPAFLFVAEVFLYAAFAGHIYLALVTYTENNSARDHGYNEKQTKRDDRAINFFGLTPDTTMFLTGAIVFLFLILHLYDFKFERFGDGGLASLEPYDKAGAILGDTFTKVAYAIGSLFLGVHVSHGFASAFQSLGLRHPRYVRCIEWTGVVFAIVVALGFASFVSLGNSDRSTKTGAAVSVESQPAATMTRETPGVSNLEEN
jgi:succinate dehydrogenase cytochrome b subunit